MTKSVNSTFYSWSTACIWKLQSTCTEDQEVGKGEREKYDERSWKLHVVKGRGERKSYERFIEIRSSVIGYSFSSSETTAAITFAIIIISGCGRPYKRMREWNNVIMSKWRAMEAKEPMHSLSRFKSKQLRDIHPVFVHRIVVVEVKVEGIWRRPEHQHLMGTGNYRRNSRVWVLWMLRVILKVYYFFRIGWVVLIISWWK